jgi:hypothetical protein
MQRGGEDVGGCDQEEVLAFALGHHEDAYGRAKTLALTGEACFMPKARAQP